MAAIVAGVVAAWILLVALLWLRRPRGIDLRDAVRTVPDVLRLARSLVADRTAPLGVRFALVGLLAWLLSPIDLIPEFIPVLGPFDDIVVAILVLRYVDRRLGRQALRRRWPGRNETWAVFQRLL